MQAAAFAGMVASLCFHMQWKTILGLVTRMCVRSYVALFAPAAPSKFGARFALSGPVCWFDYSIVCRCLWKIIKF